MSDSTPFRLGYPAHQYGLAFGAPEKPRASLAERHRPKSLDEMVGQGPIVWRLKSFLEAPYSVAFLFEGPTGVGKTTAALALAAELGAVEFGGLEQIKSGMQDAEAVMEALNSLRFTPMLGSGWKVVIVDEADYMSQKASQIWLSALEDLPPRSVVVFTTNKADRFPDRFLDRCERFTFDSDATTHAQDGQALIDSVWAREGYPGPAPRFADLPNVVGSDGQLSYRRIMRSLETLMHEAKAAPAKAVETPTVPAEKPAEEPRRSRAKGLPPRKRDNIDWSAVAQRYRDGESFRDLSVSLNVPETTIHGRLKKLGVQFNRRKAVAL